MCAVGGSAVTAKRRRWFTALLVGRNRVTVLLFAKGGKVPFGVFGGVAYRVHRQGPTSAKEEAMGEGEVISASTHYLTTAEGGGDVWSAEAASAGRRGTQKIVSAGEVTAPERVADLLAVEQGGQVVGRRRIMYLDGEPCELTDTYYPVEIARGTGLAGTAKIRGGAVRLLAELGHVGVRAREDVAARMPSESERAELALRVGEPVLELTRLTLDAHDRPIQADVMVMPPRGQRLRYEIRIG